MMYVAGNSQAWTSFLGHIHMHTIYNSFNKGGTHLHVAGHRMTDAAGGRRLFQEVGLRLPLRYPDHGRDGLEQVHVVCVCVLLRQHIRELQPDLCVCVCVCVCCSELAVTVPHHRRLTNKKRKHAF